MICAFWNRWVAIRVDTAFQCIRSQKIFPASKPEIDISEKECMTLSKSLPLSAGSENEMPFVSSVTVTKCDAVFDVRCGISGSIFTEEAIAIGALDSRRNNLSVGFIILIGKVRALALVNVCPTRDA